LTGPFEKRAPAARSCRCSSRGAAAGVAPAGWTGLALLALAAATMVLIGQRMPTC